MSNIQPSYPPSFLILGSLVYALTLLVVIGVIPIYIYLRKEPVIRHRNLYLEALYWVMMNLLQIRFFYGIYKSNQGEMYVDCAGYVWVTGLIGPVAILAILVRAIRLYLIYHITKDKLHREESESDIVRSSNRWLNPKFITTPYLFLLYFVMLGTWTLIPLITTVYFLSAFGDFTEAACNGPTARFGGITSVLSLILLLLIIGWKLRHVHDAFFMKKELNCLAIIAVFMILPTYPVSFVTEWGWILLMVDTLAVLIVSFAVPSFLAIKSHYTKKYGESSISATTEEMSESGSLSSYSRTQFVRFSNFPKVAKFLQHNNGLPYLERYMLHYQEIEMSNTLLLWSTIQKFKEIQDNTTLVAKAYLLMQKFLLPDSYIHVSCIPDKKRNELVGTITKQMNAVTDGNVEEGESITPSIFDGVLEDIESELHENLFLPFFKSDMYKEYQRNEVALSKGLSG